MGSEMCIRDRDDGVAGVDVTTSASANVGVALGKLEDELEAGYSSDINFTVDDDASSIASVLVAGNELDNAEDVDVVGGVVDVAAADAVQDITAYDAVDSDYDISDNAASLLSSTGVDTVVDSGVDTVNVTDPSVDAATGAGLNELELALEGVGGTDIDFTVEDTAGAVASELSLIQLSEPKRPL